MNAKLRRRFLFILLFLSYLLFSYYALGGWWNSSAGTLLILFFSYLIWGKDFLKMTGLNITLKGIVWSLLILLLVILCSYLLIREIAEFKNTVLTPGDWRDYYHEVFYIMNEEIVLGAIVLFTMTGKWKMNPVLACLALALLFALVHFIFYKWIFNDHGVIRIFTLVTLFMIGFLRNSLIMLSGHIGFSWALHFGWMAVMFGTLHTNGLSGERIGEPERFNTYLGTAQVLVISLILAGTGLFFLLNRRNHGVVHAAK